jgi:dTDP-4-dehydrorhamnose 3,5-epimerase-like enzyme
VDESKRGGHRHHKTIQAAICIKGSCTIYNNDGQKEETFVLDQPNKCLIIEPKDWHTMYNFTPDAILMVFASEYFDANDYIHQSY